MPDEIQSGRGVRSVCVSSPRMVIINREVRREPLVNCSVLDGGTGGGSEMPSRLLGIQVRGQGGRAALEIGLESLQCKQAEMKPEQKVKDWISGNVGNV